MKVAWKVKDVDREKGANYARQLILPNVRSFLRCQRFPLSKHTFLFSRASLQAPATFFFQIWAIFRPNFGYCVNSGRFSEKRKIFFSMRDPSLMPKVHAFQKVFPFFASFSSWACLFFNVRRFFWRFDADYQAIRRASEKK